MALSIFLRDSIERRVSTSLVNGNERSWFRHYQKKAGWWNNKLELRERGRKRSGSKPNNANFISSVYNFASKRGSRLGCFDAHHAVTNYRVSQLERNYSLANGTILFLLFFFFHFDIQWNWTRSRHDAFFSPPLLSVESLLDGTSYRFFARTINFNKKTTRRIKF